MATPDEVIKTARPKRSTGILWDHLSEEKIAAIPELARSAPRGRDAGHPTG
ncbi:hypothetical protein FHU38_005101 [Saccharomonospora amisosensis]|uniref:Uncharacterized protein n=1 Tax=Saccharomonospora amisosensis TaxID=1128677 RepID=A0A7X5UV42_9PSEU|nr:hypothetical protein [Saccharomonospora amisosensis]NIJ14700.1 hypothetical protein [Saccharomonospora amisosensis]